MASKLNRMMMLAVMATGLSPAVAVFAQDETGQSVREERLARFKAENPEAAARFEERRAAMEARRQEMEAKRAEFEANYPHAVAEMQAWRKEDEAYMQALRAEQEAHRARMEARWKDFEARYPDAAEQMRSFRQGGRMLFRDGSGVPRQGGRMLFRDGADTSSEGGRMLLQDGENRPVTAIPTDSVEDIETPSLEFLEFLGGGESLLVQAGEGTSERVRFLFVDGADIPRQGIRMLFGD